MRSRGKPPVGYEASGDARDSRPGEPDPIVLLHPFPFDRRGWTRLGAVLASGHRVITIDARGFGESPLTGPYAITDLADDVAALLDELGFARATLLGVSMGGYTALAFAQRHPQRLTRLILADTRAAADSPEVRAGRESAMHVIGTAGVDTYLATSLPRLLAPNASPTELAELRAQAETRPASLLAGIVALRDRPDRSRELASIHCPTLIICGEAEQVVPLAEMRDMAERIPGATFVSVPGAGHLTHFEAPAAFERAVSAFLAATSIPRVAMTAPTEVGPA